MCCFVLSYFFVTSFNYEGLWFHGLHQTPYRGCSNSPRSPHPPSVINHWEPAPAQWRLKHQPKMSLHTSSTPPRVHLLSSPAFGLFGILTESLRPGLTIIRSECRFGNRRPCCTGDGLSSHTKRNHQRNSQNSSGHWNSPTCPPLPRAGDAAVRGSQRHIETCPQRPVALLHGARHRECASLD